MLRLVVTTLSLALLSGCVTQTSVKGSEKPVFQRKFDPQDAAHTRIALGLNYLKNGEPSQAKYNLEKALTFAPKMPEVHISLAYYYQMVNEHGLAIKSYEKAIDLDPKNPDTLNNYGAFLCKVGQYEKAEKLMLRAIKVPSYIRVADTYENLGLCALEHDLYDKGEEYLTFSLSHNPFRANTLLSLAALAYAKSDYVAARTYLERMDKNNKMSARGLMLRHKVERIMGNVDAAKTYASMLVKLFPESYEAQSYIKNRLHTSEFERLKNRYEEHRLQELLKASTMHGNADQTTNKSEKRGQPSAAPKIKIVKKKSPAASSVEINTQATSTVQTSIETAQNKQGSDEVLSRLSAKPTINKRESQQEDAEPLLVNGSVSDSDTVKEQAVKDVTDETASTTSTNSQVFEQVDAYDDLTTNQIIARLKKVEVPFHRVEKGDTLYLISMKYNIRMEKLMEWNDLTENGPLFADSKVYLKSPKVYHAIKEGDTLYGLALKYKVRLSKLLKWNKMKKDDRITLGQKIIIVNPSKY
ncbi:type IV pilus biogenesis/stability protein PilW [Flocculibacter collagenilyticus]|uniref:type IV pilus biogenesis/stability protein PilW n=1 Tax=Flocculibacter collagenilyticus TaxID=2744479 RepID=UPI0018F2B2BC|nr:type IV pilus biogenesis/stability protein PilW [Flocculibacter collagenilyticus]